MENSTNFTVEVSLLGISPFIMCKYHEDKKIGKTRYDGEWKDKLHLNSDGKVIVPQEMLRACFQNGSKGIKKGRIFMTRIIQPSILIKPFEPLLLVGGKPVDVEKIEEENWIKKCPVKLSRASTVIRQRAEFPPGWRVDFTIRVVGEKLDLEYLEAILKESGVVAGLGDWRPSSPRPGAYGCFTLRTFRRVE